MHKNRFSFLVSRLSSLIVAILFSSLAFGQEKVQMADTMRSNGKIYVVVAVCLTILLGLFLYVFSVDRKLSKLERSQSGTSK